MQKDIDTPEFFIEEATRILEKSSAIDNEIDSNLILISNLIEDGEFKVLWGKFLFWYGEDSIGKDFLYDINSKKIRLEF